MNEHVQTRGTLIIVPGWMHTSREWAQAAKQLPEWDVHVIDLPGFGIEPLVSTDWGVPEYAQYVIENSKYKIENIRAHTNTEPAESSRENSLVEPEQRATRGLFREKLSSGSKNTHKVVLLGHSFGGRVLAHIFGTQSESAPHADALILYAAPCLYRPRLVTRARRYAARAAHMLGVAGLLPDRWKPYDLRQATDAGLGEIFKRSVGYDQTEDVKHIRIPTHLVWGSADTSVPLRIAEEMQTLIASAELTALPNEGHNIHLDNPGLFYGALRKILTTLA